MSSSGRSALSKTHGRPCGTSGKRPYGSVRRAAVMAAVIPATKRTSEICSRSAVAGCPFRWTPKPSLVAVLGSS